jgi:predicted NBD/HSP70 family sugar kinase
MIALSTGFGGAGFTDARIFPDEPGHAFLKEGAICGCGADGHVEAHVSGSGIERKYGVTADQLPDRKWKQVVGDLTQAHLDLLERLKEDLELKPVYLYYFGSVATRSPFALPGLAARLSKHKKRPDYLEGIKFAAHRNDSGLIGATEVALELASKT